MGREEIVQERKREQVETSERMKRRARGDVQKGEREGLDERQSFQEDGVGCARN